MSNNRFKPRNVNSLFPRGKGYPTFDSRQEPNIFGGLKIKRALGEEGRSFGRRRQPQEECVLLERSEKKVETYGD